jgi:hypothetical protein
VDEPLLAVPEREELEEAVTRIEIDGRWANPPAHTLHRIYIEARRATARRGSSSWGDHRTFDGLSQRAAWQRRVSAEFHRRLLAAGIYVEGA